ncbi:MAG: methyltransferase [Glaciihabitans sp.]
MSDDTVIYQNWVAFGPAGAIGSVHRIDEGFTFRLLGDDTPRATYPSLEVAKSALFAALPPGTDWPEFKEH